MGSIEIKFKCRKCGTEIVVKKNMPQISIRIFARTICPKCNKKFTVKFVVTIVCY